MAARNGQDRQTATAPEWAIIESSTGLKTPQFACSSLQSETGGTFTTELENGNEPQRSITKAEQRDKASHYDVSSLLANATDNHGYLKTGNRKLPSHPLRSAVVTKLPEPGPPSKMLFKKCQKVCSFLLIVVDTLRKNMQKNIKFSSEALTKHKNKTNPDNFNP
jgi:hypothetical protein